MPSKLFEPQYWRDRAAQARAHADTTRDPGALEHLQRIARTYEGLAERAETLAATRAKTISGQEACESAKALPTILLVDDEDAFRYATTKVLEDHGFTVSAHRDHNGALAVLESDVPIDLLVTDIVMPDRMHGFALARMARLRRPGMKVIHLTGYDVPTTEANGPVLRKPISADTLVSEIRRALNSGH